MPFLGGATLAAMSWPTGSGGVADRGRAATCSRSSIGSRPRSIPRADLARPAREIIARLSYPKAVAWIIARLAEALDYAYSRGVLHGDVKPSNILLTADGEPMLLDFNLAVGWRSPSGDDLPGDAGGTLAYMAPERLRAVAQPEQAAFPKAADRHRADLYALGMVLLEALAGRTPDHPRGSPRTPREMAAALARSRQQGAATLIRSCRVSIAPGLAVDRGPLPGARSRRSLQPCLRAGRGPGPLVQRPSAGLCPGAALAVRRAPLGPAPPPGRRRRGPFAGRRGRQHAGWSGGLPGPRSGRMPWPSWPASGTTPSRRCSGSGSSANGGSSIAMLPKTPFIISLTTTSSVPVIGVRATSSAPCPNRSARSWRSGSWSSRYGSAVRSGSVADSPDDWRRGLEVLDRVVALRPLGPLETQCRLLRRQLGLPEPSAPNDPASGPNPPPRWMEEYLLGVEAEPSTRQRTLWSIIRTCLQERPESFWGHYRAAAMAYRLRDPAAAADHLEHCIRRRPENAALRGQLAGCLYDAASLRRGPRTVQQGPDAGSRPCGVVSHPGLHPGPAGPRRGSQDRHPAVRAADASPGQDSRVATPPGLDALPARPTGRECSIAIWPAATCRSAF